MSIYHRSTLLQFTGTYEVIFHPNTNHSWQYFITSCWQDKVGFGQWMNLSIIHDNVCSLLHKKCRPKRHHGDLKYHMTLIIMFSVMITYCPNVYLEGPNEQGTLPWCKNINFLLSLSTPLSSQESASFFTLMIYISLYIVNFSNINTNTLLSYMFWDYISMHEVVIDIVVLLPMPL